MKLPNHTSDIFEILSKGQFICSNSCKDSTRKLYNIIDEYREELTEYFEAINLKLVKEDEYYMFTRTENKTDLERKIEAAFKWIDILDFLKTYDHSFGSGYRFTPADILSKMAVDVDLKNKLEGLKKYAAGKEKHAEILDKILDQLRKDNFIDLENEITNSYKTLASFHYLEKLILTLNLPESVQNEILK